ncbi:HupE/UreJ family protein [Dokdonella sp.]|uniref:HupE/UreJ family protein n=1 Tax=Dokdonella sp. TaxID=2291710 RepID=UPI0035278DE3
MRPSSATPGSCRPKPFACACWLIVAWLACLGTAVQADVFRPAYLELREEGADRYSVLWKVPAQGDRKLDVQIAFPEGTETLGDAQALFNDGAYVERWRIRREGGLVGETLRVEGIAAGVTDVIVRVEREDGTSQVERMLPDDPQFTIIAASGIGEVAWSYFVLGVEHILAGFDHLLFVLALLLIVRGGKRIFLTITAFTLAHSITLVSATLGWMRVPGPPVEAIIALSIVFVAAEVVHGLQGRPGLTARAPWVVAFAFGLLHGFGFAGALAEVGLPQKAIPVALLMFNVGVEVGQLIFVAFALSLKFALVRLPLRWPAWASYVGPYSIGVLAMFWVIERVDSFWQQAG